MGANPPWTWLSLYEFVVVVVTVVGMSKCYDAAGGDRNDRFAADFSCLSFAATFWTTTSIWAVYWAVWWLFRSGIMAAYKFEHLGLAQNLALIGGGFEWLWTFLALAGWQVVFFWLLKASLQHVAHERQRNSQLSAPASPAASGAVFR